VHFSQHSAGTWVDAPHLEYAAGSGRPVASASLHGHAFVLPGGGAGAAGVRGGRDTERTGGPGLCEVVSAEHLGVAEPAWLGFMRPWGPTEVHDVGRVINRVARAIRERLVNKVFVGDGATGPKKHGSWINDERRLCTGTFSSSSATPKNSLVHGHELICSSYLTQK